MRIHYQKKKKNPKFQFTMSAQAYNNNTAPSDKDTPSQDRGIFHHEAAKHQSHHYMRTYGGQVLHAAMWGFGATLGADVANAAVGDVKVSFCRNVSLFFFEVFRSK